MLQTVVLAVGDTNDNVWTGLSGIVLGLLIGLALVIFIFKQFK